MTEEGEQPAEQGPEHSEEDDYEAVARSTADYANYAPPQKPRNPLWGKLLKIIIGLVVLAVLAGGAFWFLKNHKSTPAKTAQTVQPPATAKVASTTKHYDSSNFYLGFDYPANWTVVDNGGGVMTVTSPKTQLKSLSGQQVNGKIIMTIRDKTQKLPEFNAGNATAALASVKITYSKPTQTQRGSTYESFLRWASTANSNGLDGVYITGDAGYTAGQAIPAADFVPVDPVIDITFFDASGKDMTISASAWANTSFSGPLDKMLESLAIT